MPEVAETDIVKLARSLEQVSKNIDHTKKTWLPLWAVVGGLIFGGVWFGSFVREYQFNAENGSPGIKRMFEEVVRDQQKRDDKQDETLAGVKDILESVRLQQAKQAGKGTP